MIYILSETFSCGGIDNIPIVAAKIVTTIVNLIRIIVPVVLVILGMIDLFSAMIKQKEDEMKKAQMLFVKRLIAGLLVFFVVAIVQMVFGILANASGESGMLDCVSYFLNSGIELKEKPVSVLKADGGSYKTTFVYNRGIDTVDRQQEVVNSFYNNLKNVTTDTVGEWMFTGAFSSKKINTTVTKVDMCSLLSQNNGGLCNGDLCYGGNTWGENYERFVSKSSYNFYPCYKKTIDNSKTQIVCDKIS